MSAADFGESWCSAARIADAARRCAKRKRGRADAMAFRLREGEEVLALAERLRTGTYHPEPGRVFPPERLASYDGHLVHANSFALRERLWADHPIARRFLARRRGTITRRFALTRAAPSLRVQVARLAQGIRADGASRPAVLLVQVGRFVEVPHGAWRVGLRRRKVGRRWTAGAPWAAAARLIERALGRGYSVAVALEEPEACGYVKRRRLAYLFERPSPLSPSQEKPIP